MLRRKPRAVAIRLALAVAWVALLPQLVGAAPAGAVGPDPGSSEFSSWLSDTAARALQAAEPDNDLAAGAREGLNRGLSRAFLGLQQIGPAWLRRAEVDLVFREDLQIAYDVALTQPLLRSGQGRDRLWLRGQFRHEPAGGNLSDLGLFYRQRLLGEEMTLGVNGALEDRQLLDYERFALGTIVRSRVFELRASLFDDVPGQDLLARGVPDRMLDGYDLAVAAEMPKLPWARVEARRRWQVAVDSDHISESTGLSLRLTPLPPLEAEAGTSTGGEARSWFARLRFKIALGGSG
jgi:hypothetical protein